MYLKHTHILHSSLIISGFIPVCCSWEKYISIVVSVFNLECKIELLLTNSGYWFIDLWYMPLWDSYSEVGSEGLGMCDLGRVSFGGSLNCAGMSVDASKPHVSTVGFSRWREFEPMERFSKILGVHKVITWDVKSSFTGKCICLLIMITCDQNEAI